MNILLWLTSPLPHSHNRAARKGRHGVGTLAAEVDVDNKAAAAISLPARKNRAHYRMRM
jgi:hypothetical protein